MSDKTDQPTVPNSTPAGHRAQYYTELNRIISMLFVGVLALMTFLLTVGVQRPHASFKWALYSTIVVLSLNLLAYVAGHISHTELLAKAEADKGLEAARRRLKVVRMVQQALFILAVISIAWFAMSAANFFFSIPAQPAGAPPQ
jgi:uncharacterized membrane protein